MKDFLIKPNVDDMVADLHQGRQQGEPCGILALAENFAWMRTFQYCFTGHPGYGKTTFLMMLLLVKSIQDGWKHCIWTPEMMSSKQGTVTVNDFFDDLVNMLTGKITDKARAEKYEKPCITEKEYREAMEFLEKHFFVIFPRKQTPDMIIDTFNYFHDLHKFDTFSIDPYKSLIHSETNKIYSDRMEELFSKFKYVAIRHDCVVNWVAHPRRDANFKNQDGSFKVCDEYMLSGGAAWANSMDVICAVHRPEMHDSKTSPNVQFHVHKVRKQQRIGVRPGVVDYIQFDWPTQRYWFGNTCSL